MVNKQNFNIMQFQGTIGKSFKKDAKVIMDSLSAMSLEDISKKEKDLESAGQVNIWLNSYF